MAKAPQKAQRKPVEPPKPVVAVPVAKIEIAAPEAAPALLEEPSETSAVEPYAPSITADEWAEQLRRSLNTFIGVARMARIGGDASLPEATTEAEWLRLFGEWKRLTH